MPRTTRTALRAQATTRVDDSETADASKVAYTTPGKERKPLGDILPNAIAEPVEDEPEAPKMPPKKGKGKGTKKGAKGNKGKVADEDEVDVAVLEDERRAAGSPASDAAVDELAKGPTADTNVVQVPMADPRPASPPSRAVRRTRRQLAKEEDGWSKSRPLPSPPQPEPAEEEITEGPATAEVQPGAQSETEEQKEEAIEAPAPEIVAPEVEVTAEELEPKSLKPCEDVSTPATSRAPSRSPSKSPGRSPMRLEESIEAIDALEEALEQVGKAFPLFDQSGDEKSPRKAHFDVVSTPTTRARTANAAKPSPRAATRVSRNPGAPKSLKPTPANAAKPAAPRPSIVRSASTRIASTGKGVRKGSGEVTDYLASKRRPISMSFPTPPPPAKSAKAPTKPTFQLPGEAVAAKLKAQKEERLKREEEEAAKKATFKARPVPAKKPVPAATVRQTAASKARENLANGKPAVDAGKSDAKPGAEKKELPGITIPPPPKPRCSANKRPSSVIIASRPAFTNSRSSSATASHRNSVILPLPGSVSVSKSTVTAADAAAQRLKAREIFNRDKLEKEAREKERREKEEAAKKARAEAAERGRIASREWAEKQRRKMMMMGAGTVGRTEAA